MTRPRPIRRRAAWGLCLLLAVCWPGQARAAADGGGAGGASPGSEVASADDSRALAARILAREGYQTELPGTGSEPGTAEGAPPTRRRRPPREGWRIPVPSGLGDLLEILAWVGAGAIALGVVVVAVQMVVAAVGEGRHAGGSERTPAGAPGDGDSVPGRAARPPALSEAERLAAAGRYTEAVHALLVRALAALGARGGRAFPDSATSREILASSRLPPGQRVPLGVLVEPVERAVFGGATLGADDWERCHTAYRALEGEA